jgi:hypothetical protein
MVIEFELEDKYVTVNDDFNEITVGDLCMNEELEMFHVSDMKLLNAKMSGTLYKVLNIAQK